MLCLELPTENAPVFIGTNSDRNAIELQEDMDAAHEFCDRDYSDADYIAFCKQARACAIVPLSNAELIRAYARSQRAEDADGDEWAERDRLDRQAEIAGEAAEYTSGVPTHVAYDRIHNLVESFSHKWQRSRLEIELTADLHLAAFHALRNDLTAWAFYQLLQSGAAEGIPRHILARSELYYRLRTLVGQTVIARQLTNRYFSKRRNGRTRVANLNKGVDAL